jgi:hypothetical protein
MITSMRSKYESHWLIDEEYENDSKETSNNIDRRCHARTTGDAVMHVQQVTLWAVT